MRRQAQAAENKVGDDCPAGSIYPDRLMTNSFDVASGGGGNELSFEHDAGTRNAANHKLINYQCTSALFILEAPGIDVHEVGNTACLV